MDLHIKFEKFSGGNAPRPLNWGGASMAPLSRPHSPRRSGASRLRASRLARGLRPLHRPWGWL